MTRVLHVDTSRGWRGGQTQLLALARRWPGEVAVALRPDALLVPALEREGVTVLEVGFRGRIAGTRALARVIDRFEPHVVAAQDAHALVHALRVAKGPVVAHRRVDFLPSAAGVRRLADCAGVVAVSVAVREVLARAGVPRRNIDVVRDGVAAPDVAALDVRRSLDLPSDASVLVAAGALVPHKGHDVLLRALVNLPGVHAVVVGEGPSRGGLVRLARRLGLADRVHFPGHTADVGSYLRQATIFVHPSREEGLGQVVVEALLVGAAVVTTSAGGVPEAASGIAVLVPVERPGALARALADVLRDPEGARRRAEDAHADLERRFGVERMVRETESVYLRASAARSEGHE